MKYKISILIFLFIFIPQVSFAQIPSGGNILWVSECACSGSLLVIVADLVTKAPIPIIFQFGISRLNQNFNIFTPGVETVSSWTPGGVCLMGKTACKPFPVLGTFTGYPFPGIGTSLSPSL